MGVDGVLPVALRAATRSAQDPKQAAVAPPEQQQQQQHVQSNLQQQQQQQQPPREDKQSANKQSANQEEEDEAAALARRASLPSAFGTEASTSAAASASATRRWRSFDAALLATGGSSSSASDAQAARGLARLSRRIEEESACVAQRRARLGRRREWLRSMGALFSSSRRERVALLQVQLVAEMARANRSLVVLQDMRTLALASDALGLDADPRDASGGCQALLDSLADADRALDEDCLHHVLALQVGFLQELAAMHARKDSSSSNSSALAPATESGGPAALRQFLEEVAAASPESAALALQDRPTATLVRFEKLLSRHRLLHPTLKRALEALSVDTLRSFAGPPTYAAKRPAADSAAAVFDERSPRDVMLSLVRELEDAVAGEGSAAALPAALRPTLRALVEQMVFARLACACYRGHSTDLDELNAAWRERAAKARALGLRDVGLSSELLARAQPAGRECEEKLFAGSVAAFSRLPHLVPSSVLAAFLDAVRTLYAEAAAALREPSVSADVLLPLLVFVLSRADLPHLHSQVFLMEQFCASAADEDARAGDGGEAAYYLACLQAAMGYLMGGGGDGSACGATE